LEFCKRKSLSQRYQRQKNIVSENPLALNLWDKMDQPNPHKTNHYNQHVFCLDGRQARNQPTPLGIVSAALK
jgi:hypothetical protein